MPILSSRVRQAGILHLRPTLLRQYSATVYIPAANFDLHARERPFGKPVAGSLEARGREPNMYFDDRADDKLGKVKDPLAKAVKYVKTRNPREKLIMLCVASFAALALLWLVIDDHDNLFVMAELVHFAGIGVLLWKLIKQRNSGGLSLRSQELTALFLAVRLICSFLMEYDIHTVLDALTLLATVWVIYELRGPLKSTYQAEQDNLQAYYVAAPCVLVALIAHPSTHHPILFRVMWATCVYVEAVSVLPQLRMMQKAKVVEKFTAHYVFALGFSRFISCAHWILQIIDGDSFLLKAIGSGLWPAMVLLSELVQTLILADFCYYYVKSYAEGSGVIHLAAGIV